MSASASVQKIAARAVRAAYHEGRIDLATRVETCLLAGDMAGLNRLVNSIVHSDQRKRPK